MSAPPPPDTDVADRLLAAAARVLADEGPRAVSARRLATEVGASTMVVYTHFGSMDQVLAHVRREGFRRFARALELPEHTDDPVADWMTQGWSYRRFSLDEPHLYRTMFTVEIGSGSQDHGTDADAVAALATFGSLLARIERCRDATRWQVDDLALAGEVIWGTSHGLAEIELSGYFDAPGRDVHAAHDEAMRRTALGYGDDPAAVAASAVAARERALAAGLL